MKKGVWKNPVAELASDARGVYVSMWTGYRWEFWGGPFRTEADAREAVEYWECEFSPRAMDCWMFEQLDGTK
jgi:hypothetical protein